MAEEYYQIKYDDREGTEIEVRIIDVSESPGSDVITAAYGRAIIEFDQVDNPFTIMRPSTCTIELEADTSNTYSDLFTDNEREHKVELYRASSLVWEGWLSPEGIFEDYVNDSWVITLTAQDGLSDLENKAYVDSSGDLYEGKETLVNVVLNCLERTGLLTGCYFIREISGSSQYPVQYYDSPSLSVSYFNQEIDQRAFLSDDGKTPKSCKDVLEEILTGANGYVHAWAGNFYVNWNYQHAVSSLNGSYAWSYYLANGSVGTTETRDTSITIGSQINDFTTHWINENQRIERRPKLGAANITYKFRPSESILSNPELDNNGSTITGWTESLDAASNDVVTLNSAGTVTLENGSQTSAVFTSDASASDAEEATVLNVIFNFDVPTITYDPFLRTKFKFRLFLDGTTNYYLNKDNEWTTTASDYTVLVRRSGKFEVEIQTPPLPLDGAVTLSIYPLDDNSGSTFYSDEITLEYVGVSNNEANPPEGITYEAQRTTGETSYTSPTLEVSVGDFQGVAYLGTFYKSDGVTPVSDGYESPLFSSTVSLYDLTLTNRMQLMGKTLRVFSGDVYGFFRYDSRIAIDGIGSTFWMITGWSWDTKENTISATMWEAYNEGTAGTGILVEEIINYGNVIEPTIKS